MTQDEAFRKQALSLAHTVFNAQQEMDQYIEGIENAELKMQTADECDDIVDYGAVKHITPGGGKT